MRRQSSALVGATAASRQLWRLSYARRALLIRATRTDLQAAATAAAEPPPSAPPPPPPRPTPDVVAKVGPPKGGALLLQEDVVVFASRGDPTATEPVARGVITGQIADNVYTVKFVAVPQPTVVVELGSRVHCRRSAIAPSAPPYGGGGFGAGRGGGRPAGAAPPGPPPAAAPADGAGGAQQSEAIAGLVAKVRGNGLYAVLFDDDRYDAQVPRSAIISSEGPPRFMQTNPFRFVLAWVRDAGVSRQADQEATACVLFHRGWRVEKLYLLEGSDVHCLSHLNKSVRMGLLERADWEREKHRQRRDFDKERLKEKEWRYLITKYSSVVSACVAFCGVLSVFTWNFKNWQKTTRRYQLNTAADAFQDPNNWRRGETPAVQRSEALATMEGILQRMNPLHPRIIVISGAKGSGKSVLVQEAALRHGVPAMHVTIRSKEDPLRAIAKHAGVTNVDLCGDLLDFAADMCRTVRQRTGKVPLVLLKLQDGIDSVYAVAEALACERAVCHVIIECPAEHAGSGVADLLHVDAFTVAPFTREDAARYASRSIDPLALEAFVDVVGTNPNDLDELIASVTQRGLRPAMVAHAKVSRAAAQLRDACAGDALAVSFVRALARAPLETGLAVHGQSADGGRAVEAKLRRFVIYNHTLQRWQFSSALYHYAAAAVFS